jgi:hypothetical protein
MLILLSTVIYAQDLGVTLVNTIKQFESDTSISQIALTNNRFEMIASKWDQEWITHYYASYGLIIQSYMEPEESKRDGLLDLSETYLRKAEELNKKETDELDILNALLANARLAVKPGNRWKKYGDIFNEYIARAKAINPNNPRIYYLQGNSLFYTPKMFGGGAQAAMPLFEKSNQIYQSELVTDSLSTVPSWGKTQNFRMLSTCIEELKEKK